MLKIWVLECMFQRGKRQLRERLRCQWEEMDVLDFGLLRIEWLEGFDTGQKKEIDHGICDVPVAVVIR